MLMAWLIDGSCHARAWPSWELASGWREARVFVGRKEWAGASGGRQGVGARLGTTPVGGTRDRKQAGQRVMEEVERTRQI